MILSFSSETKQALITIARETQVYLDGNILKLINPGDDPDFLEYYAEAVRRDKLARQRRLAITKQIQHQNKELIYHNGQNRLLNDEFTRALEEQKKSGEKLKATLSKLEKQNKDLAQFSWMVSHNLRGPLASAMGIMNLMKDFNLVTPDNQDMYGHLKSSVDKMDEIIHDVSILLEMRRDPPLFNELIDMAGLMMGCSGQLETLQSESGADFKYDFACCTTVFGTRIYVENILTNLLSNAMLYRSPDRPLQIQVTSDSEPGCCLIMVTDNGNGIRESELEKVFEPFRKLDYKSTGKGIGLYLARTQAEAMGGTLTVVSQEGVGSTFTLRLPNDSQE